MNITPDSLIDALQWECNCDNGIRYETAKTVASNIMDQHKRYVDEMMFGLRSENERLRNELQRLKVQRDSYWQCYEHAIKQVVEIAQLLPPKPIIMDPNKL